MNNCSAIRLVVSVVLYRPNLPHLRETLKSVYASSLNVKVVVYDNSPAPLPREFLEEFTDLIYEAPGKNLGYGRAHNVNIEKYSKDSPYFLVLNPDVFFSADLLSTLLKRMDADKKIGLSIPRICHPTGALQLVNRRLPRPQDYLMNFANTKLKKRVLRSSSYDKFHLKDIDTSKPFTCPTISGCFMLFRSSVLRAVGGFDKRYFLYLEDTDLSRRVAINYATVVFSDLTAYHHWTRGAYKSPKLFMLFLTNLVRYFTKWGWFYDHQRDKLNQQVGYYTLDSPRRVNSVLKKSEIFDSLS